jgi:hypothetical protein
MWAIWRLRLSGSMTGISSWVKELMGRLRQQDTLKARLKKIKKKFRKGMKMSLIKKQQIHYQIF